MVKRALGVTRPLGDRLQKLVCEAYPKGSKYRTNAIQVLSMMPLDEARHLGDYIRQLRAGRHQQPPPARAWELGAALGVLSGKRWINPVIALFACGHYGIVADLFLRVATRSESRSELSELARTLRTVLQDGVAPRYALIRDDLAIRESKNWDASFRDAERYDRRVWSLDGPGYAAFAEAWRQITSSGSPHMREGSHTSAIAACQLIADAAQYPVPDRDRFASLIIADAVVGQ